MGKHITSERELIQRFLAPLAQGLPGALGLADDCAMLSPPQGCDVVATMDAVAEGVHFLASDPPQDVAFKALAVNVSDLAAKGARPYAYLMALSFPQGPQEEWMAAFASGLREAQQLFGLHLAGGDTDRRPGPLTLTITALGTVPAGAMVRRAPAAVDDLIYVSGTIGDGALGLMVGQHDPAVEAWGMTNEERAYLLQRYRRPQPRLALTDALHRCASASMDISDGLAMDLSRMCVASGTGAVIDAVRVPLSKAVSRALAADPNLMKKIVTGGDDYEILAAIGKATESDFCRMAADAGVGVTRIGTFSNRSGLVMNDADGRPMKLDEPGWDHFARS